MKAIFENKFNLTRKSLELPFMSGDLIIGIISEVKDDTFTVLLFDKFIGVEKINNDISAVYISHHEQMSPEEFMNMTKKSE